MARRIGVGEGADRRLGIDAEDQRALLHALDFWPGSTLVYAGFPAHRSWAWRCVLAALVALAAWRLRAAASRRGRRVVKTVTVIVLNWNGADDTIALLGTLERCRIPSGLAARRAGGRQRLERRLARADRRRAFRHRRVLALAREPALRRRQQPGLRRALAAGADAVMLLNNDTEADPGAARATAAGARAGSRRAGAVAPLIYFAPPSDRDLVRGRARQPGARHRARTAACAARDRGQYRAVEPTGYLTGCCLLARREAWEQVGLLDERYFIYAEDADWSPARARRSASGCCSCPTARLWHKRVGEQRGAEPVEDLPAPARQPDAVRAPRARHRAPHLGARRSWRSRRRSPPG